MTCKTVMFWASALVLALVAAGQCDDDQLSALGFLPTDMTEESRSLAFKSTLIMATSGRVIGTSRNCKKTAAYNSYLAKAYQLLGGPAVSETCLECFAKNIKCNFEHCKVDCIKDECSQKCIDCNAKHCKPELLSCTGATSLANPCQFRDEYAEYKSRRENQVPAISLR